MRTLLLGLLAITGFQMSAFAATSAPVTLSAQTGAQTLQLSVSQYQDVYGQEPYQATCNRSVFDHNESSCQTVYDSVCHGGGEVCQTVNDSVCNSSGCTTVPRRVCQTTAPVCQQVPRQSCSTRAVYRTEYYACTQYRTVVTGQELVKTYNHQVEVSIADPSALNGAQLNLVVGANLGAVSATLQGSFPAGLLSYKITTLSQNDVGNVSNISERIVISLAVPAAVANQILNASLPSAELGRNAIRFTFKNGAQLANNLKIAINLVRNRAIGANTTLYNDSLDSSTLSLVGQGTDLSVLIPLQRLNVEALGSNKYDLGVSISLNTGSDTLLNANDFTAQINQRAAVSYSRINATF
jgi:hypothetical protein